MPHQCLKCGQLFNEGTTTILRGCPECRGTRFFYTQTPLTVTERDKLLATSEITLREAIEKLTKQAKDDQVIEEEPDGSKWIISGPPATTVVADNTFTPPDLIEAREAKARADEKLIVKLRAKQKRAQKRAQMRWDYAAPEPAAPPRAEPPLFSKTGLKEPTAPVPEPTATPETAAPAPTPTPPPAPWAPVDSAPAPVASPPPAPAPAPKVEDAKPAPDAVVPTPAPSALEAVAARAPPAEPTPDPQGAPETIRITKPGEYEIDVKRLMDSNPIVIQRDGTYLIHLASLFESPSKKRGQ